MDSLKVLVENITPPESWYVKWAPIIIAICALYVSLYSLYLSRRQYRDSSRPFLFCLTNYLAIQSHGDPFIRLEILPYKVTNAPALIKKMNIEFYILSEGQKTILHSDEEKNLYIFPAEQIETTYTNAELAENLNQCGQKDILERFVRFDYTALSGGKEYYFESKSQYNFVDNSWKSYGEKGS